MRYVYDGTFEGALCAVHHAYYNHQVPEEIVSIDGLQEDLFGDYIMIETDEKKYKDVYHSIPRKISYDALYTVYNVFLSNEADKATVIYNFLRLGYQLGYSVYLHHQNEWVLRAQKINRYVTYEAHRLKGFARFADMDGGILYAEITPINNVLELLCPYFSDRLRSQPWIIYDKKRGIAGIYDTSKWVISQVNHAVIPQYSEDEQHYQDLWRLFYKTITVEGRENPNLRRQLMPKMYWKNMTEFK